VWADVLLNAERQHLIRIFAWSGLSVVAGTAVFVLLAVRRVRSALLTHFAIQMIAWGAVCAAIALFAWNDLQFRDVAGAARLERFLWLNIGLDAGYFGIGATLALTGRLLGRRMALVGAGIAIAVQGVALFLLDVQFASLVSR
jgi:hypothetical protein